VCTCIPQLTRTLNFGFFSFALPPAQDFGSFRWIIWSVAPSIFLLRLVVLKEGGGWCCPICSVCCTCIPRSTRAHNIRYFSICSSSYTDDRDLAPSVFLLHYLRLVVAKEGGCWCCPICSVYCDITTRRVLSSSVLMCCLSRTPCTHEQSVSTCPRFQSPSRCCFILISSLDVHTITALLSSTFRSRKSFRYSQHPLTVKLPPTFLYLLEIILVERV